MKGARWIEFAGILAGFILIAVAGFSQFRENVSQAETAIEPAQVVLDEITLLREQITDLAAKGRTYLDEPPREYELYFRDTAVVHPILVRDVERIDGIVERMTSPDEEGSRNHLDRILENPELRSGLAAVEEAWDAFKSEFANELGIDPEMPRLEWGARHLAEGTGPVQKSIQSLADQLRRQAADDDSGSSAARTLAWPPLATALWAVLALAWFHFRARRSAGLQSGA